MGRGVHDTLLFRGRFPTPARFVFNDKKYRQTRWTWFKFNRTAYTVSITGCYTHWSYIIKKVLVYLCKPKITWLVSYLISHNLFTCTRVGTLIVATIYLQLIQNRYMFRSFTVLQCSHQQCVQPVASDVEVVGYL